MLASLPVILLACNSQFCDSILTPISKASFKTETHRLSPLKTLKSTNHMKTTTTLPTAQNAEATLGWNTMPAYGEVMNTLLGTDHTNVTTTLNAANKSIASSFWSMLSSLK